MKALIQRVSSSQVKVDGKVAGSIENGLLVFVGIEKQDTKLIADTVSYTHLRAHETEAEVV